MEYMVYALFAFNAIVSIYYLIKMIKQGTLKRFIKVSDDTFTKSSRNEAMKKIHDLSVVPRIIVIVVLLIIFIPIFAVLIAIPTFFIWIPILVGVLKGWQLGILTFIGCSFIISVIWSTFISLKREKIHDGEAAVVREFIFLLFFIQLGVIAYFHQNMNVIHSMQFIYENITFFNNTFSILYPILFFGMIATNIYLVFHFFRIKFKKNKEWKIRRTDVMLIFVASSFIGLLFISESDSSFITDIDAFNSTKDIVKVFLTAILIPLAFGKLKYEKTSVTNEEQKEIKEE